MRAFYSLRIETEEIKYNLVSDIIGLRRNSFHGGWTYEVIVGDSDPPFNFIDGFTSALEGKFDKLAELNITPKKISTRAQIMAAYKQAYRAYPQWIEAASKYLGF